MKSEYYRGEIKAMSKVNYAKSENLSEDSDEKYREPEKIKPHRNTINKMIGSMLLMA